MKRAILIGVAIICAISLSACGKAEGMLYIQGTDNNISEDSQPDDSIEEELQTSEPVETKEETSMPSEPEETELGQIHWQVYIQPDMPEPFIEVLRLYEEFMNADKQNWDEDVWEKIHSTDGEWRYLYDELCGAWGSAVEFYGEETDVIRYSLKDLTGDGYPELIMGYYISDDTVIPEVVYYHSQTEGIKMVCYTRYYTMELYEGGVIEYISAGRTRTETFYQFQEETESWQMAVRVVVDWDPWTDSLKGYYWGDNVKDLTDNRPMSEDEYQKIIAQYATEPMELEWTQFVFHSESAD